MRSFAEIASTPGTTTRSLPDSDHAGTDLVFTHNSLLESVSAELNAKSTKNEAPVEMSENALGRPTA